jgi:hypothetical protein
VLPLDDVLPLLEPLDDVLPLELVDPLLEPLVDPLLDPLLEPLEPPLLEPLDCVPPTHTGTVVDVPFGAAGWHVDPDGQSCDESQKERHWPPMQMSFDPHDAVPCVSSHEEPAVPGPALRHE